MNYESPQQFKNTMNDTNNSITDIDLPPNSGSGDELPSISVWAAGVFAFSATMISMVAIWMQLKHYRKPLLQRYVVRILWMVPIFAISSWISLVSLNMAFYVDALRDIYEAFVIYCFFGLLVSYLGGERALLNLLHGRPYTKHLFPVNLWYREIDVGDPYSFLFIKRGILQYVYVKPILAAITMLLKSNDAYNDGSVSLKSGYFWVSFFYNLSVCLSLYCLGIFFMATQGDLEELRPIPKFLCIKAVIFFSFWQGFAISILVATGVMSNTSPEMAVAIQDFLICFEMIFASVGHWYAFSHRDYTEVDIQSARMPVYYAIRDACGIQDIIQDSLDTLKGTRFTYRTFEPSEGVATVGKSRSGRIQAGLRYSQGGASKYWLPEQDSPPVMSEHHRYDSSSSNDSETDHQQEYLSKGRPEQQQQHQHHTRRPSTMERAPSLNFRDLEANDDDDDGIEELYDASKQLEFGDYNFPAIDVYDPNKIQEEQERKRARRISKSGAGAKKSKRREYPKSLEDGPLDDTTTLKGCSSVFSKEGWNFSVLPTSTPPISPQLTTTRARIESSSSESTSSSSPSLVAASRGGMIQTRDGCIDNVNGYVAQSKHQRSKRGASSSSGGHVKPERFSQDFGYQSYQQPFEQDPLHQQQ